MSSPPAKQLKVLVFSLDGFGHINSAAGISEKIAARGHKVYFALEQAWKGTLAKFPLLTEVHYVDKTRDPSGRANEHWGSIMQKFKVTFAKDPFEVLKLSDKQLAEDFMFVLLNVDDEFKRIIEEIQPDVILIDTYVTVPAIYNSGRPWVRMVSAAPLIALPADDILPPPFTGYAVDSDRALWKKYIDVWEEYVRDMTGRYNEAMAKRGIPPHKLRHQVHPSPYLNIYAYPLELDYLDLRPLPEKWARFDHFIRETETVSPDADKFKLPDDFIDGQHRVVYVSMGSLGCNDKDLLQRLLDLTADSDYRFIFSLGPFADELKLASNHTGGKFLPQTKLLPLVDLVITHGGNNSLLESLYNGKPVIVAGLFGDQYDNAQRVCETNYGRKLNPYECSRQQLLGTIEEILGDETIVERVRRLGERMRASKATEAAARAIEQVALDAQSDS